MEELLKEILSTMQELVKSTNYQTKLLEEMIFSREEQVKNREAMLGTLTKYRNMMKDSPIMKVNPEVAKAMDELFAGLVPPEG